MMSQEIQPGDDEWPSNTHNSRCAARMGRVPVDAPDDPNKITRTTPVVARQTLHRARRPLSNRLLHGVRGRAREVAGGLPRRRCANAPLGDRRARWVADGRARGGSSRRSRSRDPRGCPRRVSRDEALALGRDGRGSTRMGNFETRVCSDALIRKRPLALATARQARFLACTWVFLRPRRAWGTMSRLRATFGPVWRPFGDASRPAVRLTGVR